VTVGVLPIQAAAAVVSVDLPLAVRMGIGPIVEAAGLDAPEYLVELFFSDEEGAMKSMLTPLLVSTTWNGPNCVAGGNPSISVRKAAPATGSREPAIVWLS
jgi:hypothetical protein